MWYSFEVPFSGIKSLLAADIMVDWCRFDGKFTQPEDRETRNVHKRVEGAS